MQVHSTIEDTARVDELINSCKPVAERLARRFVRMGSAVLDFDDYVSIGMLKVWKYVDRVLAADCPVACAAVIMKCAMIDEYRHLHPGRALSLDCPFSSDSSLCIADTLVDESLTPVSIPRTSVKRARAVRSALKRLGPRQSAALKFRYGFAGYGYSPEGDVGRGVGLSGHAINRAANHGRNNLRADAELCKVVGVEVQS